MKIETLTCDELPTAAEVRPKGYLDALGATLLWETASPLLDAQRNLLLVDLSGVEMLTSAGITALIRLKTHIAPLGGRMALHSPNVNVRKVFRIVGLEGVLGLCDTREAALAALRG